MAEQLRAEPRLVQRLARPWDRVVVLERLARGGGDHRWFYATKIEEIEAVFSMLRGGSWVSFYFGDDLAVESLSEDTVGRMFEVVQAAGEIVLCTPTQGRVDVDDRGLPTGPPGLAEALSFIRPGSLVIWGRFPGPEDDGESAISIRLVDRDGVLRPHPH